MGRVIFITGCNRGIGRAVVNKFAKTEPDAKILAHARKETPEFLEFINLIKNAGVEIEPVYFDLSKPDEIKSSLTAMLKANKKIDVLVNNAGVVKEPKSFLMCDMQTLRETFEINFFAQAMITQIICRALIRNGSGAIINLSSAAGMFGAEGRFEYSASKSAIACMTKCLALELAPFKIRVNAVAPGMTDTEMISTMEDKARNNLIANSVSKRLANPDEIANVIYFLASENSSYINGQILIANGGGYSL